MTTIRLSAFSDEAADSLDGQIAALKRNGIAYTELRSVEGKTLANLPKPKRRDMCANCTMQGYVCGRWVRHWEKRTFRRIFPNTKTRCVTCARLRIFWAQTECEYSVFSMRMTSGKGNRTLAAHDGNRQ